MSAELYRVLAVNGPEEAPAVTLESVLERGHLTSIVTPAVGKQAALLVGKTVTIERRLDGHVTSVKRYYPNFRGHCPSADPLSMFR